MANIWASGVEKHKLQLHNSGGVEKKQPKPFWTGAAGCCSEHVESSIKYVWMCGCDETSMCEKKKMRRRNDCFPSINRFATTTKEIRKTAWKQKLITTYQMQYNSFMFVCVSVLFLVIFYICFVDFSYNFFYSLLL